jgi:hypothetical protein
VLIGIGTLAVMIWFPHIEGRNAHADLVNIYLRDPLLAYAYIASIPFFVALYQAFKLLGYIGQNKVFSQSSVQALRRIKYCALVLVGFIVVGEVFIMMSVGKEDRPPAVMMGLIATLISVVIATAAAVFEKLLQTAVEMKSENDLTV